MRAVSPMLALASAGTVNGDLEAESEAVLAAPARFSTVNGDIVIRER
jgi:hypothetical protein